MSRSQIQYAREVVAKDPMAKHLGIEVLEVAEAYAKLRVQVRPEYCNALARAHGMLIASLADQCAAVAANTLKERCLVTELKINYLAAAYPERSIVGEARPIHRQRTLSLWEVSIKQDERLIAVAQALTYAQAGSSLQPG